MKIKLRIALFAFIILNLFNCDHVFHLVQEQNGKEVFLFKNKCLSLKLLGYVNDKTFLDVVILFNTSDRATLFADKFVLRFNGKITKYDIWHNRKQSNEKIYYINNASEQISYGVHLNKNVKKRDEILIYADDFIKCGNEYYDLDTIRFIVK